MKRVLLLTDFFKSARNALDYGSVLFERIPTTFYLLNVCERPADSEYEGEDLNQWTGQVMNHRGISLKEVKRDNNNPKHSFSANIKPLPFADAVREVMTKNIIDVILLPTKGPRGARENFLGNDAVSAIKSIKNVPIIVVPKSLYRQKACPNRIFHQL